MDIFNWVDEIEKVYQELVDKARLENQVEIENYQKQQKEMLKTIHDKNDEFIKSNIDSLLEELKQGVQIFDNQIIKALEDIKQEYQKQKKIVINNIIHKLGFDFNG
ncbi:MAG: hypothetical protein JW891_04130 [Candidatus Lokiarchaeota archaeon]|nr:hypothetical protein [Candidatus Lokiarchaeota archaeon]